MLLDFIDGIIDSKDHCLDWIIAWVDKYILKVESPAARSLLGYKYMYDAMKNNYNVNKDIIIEEGDENAGK